MFQETNENGILNKTKAAGTNIEAKQIITRRKLLLYKPVDNN